MNKSTIKHAALITAISALTVLGATSCGNSEQKQDKQKAKTEQFKKEQKEFYRTTYQATKDSLLTVRGYDAPRFDGIETVHNDEMAIWDLEYQLNNPAIVKMDSEVVASASRIVDAYMAQVVALLNKYGLHPDLAHLSNGYKNNYQYAFVGAKMQYSDYEPEMFSCIDGFMYEYFESTDDGISEMRKTEIESKVRQILTKMESEIYRSRKSIEKKYACYYPILDPSAIPSEYVKQMLGGNDVAYVDGEGFGMSYRYAWALTPQIHAYKSVGVYDSKLEVDFFGEPDCKYELKQVSKGKWQVVRTDSRGRVAKTPVFTHNTDYELSVSPVASETSETSFDFSAGENMGVHVYSTVPVYSKTATKTYLLPKQTETRIRSQIDSLQHEVARKNHLSDERSDIREAALAQAEQIALQKLKQKYGENILINVR